MRNILLVSAFSLFTITASINANATTTTVTWTKVADENKSFTLSGSKIVRYGAGSSWVQKTLSGTQTCSNANFGKDPIFGVVKTCATPTIATVAATPTPTSYAAHFSWSIPSTRANGKALAVSELKGYEIYYTTDNPAVSGVFTISGSSNVGYDATNLSAGSYYFTISAIDTSGLKSAMSSVVALKLGQ